jgi:ferrous iron transport protein B
VTLFFFLSILEDSGYMTRVAFIMDRLLRKIGLSGKSFVPMLIGFGCTVPAVMSTRTISSKRDRFMTIFLLPFISCSAKLPIYAVFSYAFFKDYAPIAMISLYLFGIIVGIIMALIMKKTIYKGEPIPFVMELPNYRFPSFKSTMILLWEKAKDFIVRAFTVIFVATIIIWFLRSFDFRLNYLAHTENSSSILAGLAKFIAPIFTPVGFGNYESATALISGFIAKEAVISTLAVLTLTDIASLGSALLHLFSPLAAVSFLVFVLLYTPCVASIKAINTELKSKKLTALLIFSQLGIAYFMSFAIFQIGSLLEAGL